MADPLSFTVGSELAKQLSKAAAKDLIGRYSNRRFRRRVAKCAAGVVSEERMDLESDWKALADRLEDDEVRGALLAVDPTEGDLERAAKAFPGVAPLDAAWFVEVLVRVTIGEAFRTGDGRERAGLIQAGSNSAALKAGQRAIYELLEGLDVRARSLPLSQLGRAAAERAGLVGVPPSDLLGARNQLTTLVGRDQEFETLRRWAFSPEHLGLVKVVGQAGSGKTRLALELVEDLAGDGWVAGFLQQDANISQIEALVAEPADRLVVIDYAEVRPDLVEKLAKLVLTSVVESWRFRLVLLVRHDQPTLWGEETRRQLYNLSDELTLDDAPLGRVERDTLFRDACEQFVEHVANPAATVPQKPDLSREIYATPLTVMLHAYLAISGQVGSHPTVRELLDGVLGHERNYWTQVDGDIRNFERALAVWTLSPPTSRSTAIELARSVPEFSDATAERLGELATIGRTLYPMGSDGIRSLEPDRLGEHLIQSTVDVATLEVLIEKPVCSLPDVLAVAARTADDSPAFSDTLAAVLNPDRLAQVAERAIQQAESIGRDDLFTAKTISTGLNHAIQTTELETASLMALSNRLDYRPNLILSPLSLVIQQVLKKRFKALSTSNPAAYLPALAASLNNVSLRLGEVGRREEGLEASVEAVEIRRRLAEANPAAHLPDLAMSLSNLADRYDEMGRHQKATELRQEVEQLVNDSQSS